jgi:predicted nucleic acid-binding protein
MEIVVDASAVIHALLPIDAGAAPLLARLGEATCHAPYLVDAEVGSVLRRGARLGRIEAVIAEGALRTLDSLVTNRYPHGILAGAAWALRENLTYYDALYVALAARLDYPLLTADARLARSPGLPCEVELID